MKVLALCTSLLLPASLVAAKPELVNGPNSPAEQAEWLSNLKADRAKTLKEIEYNGGVFDQIKWTQSSWIQPQMHSYDRYFYDPVTHSYTVQKFLQDLKDRYGGVDAILMWPTYTNIGVDDRNQFDYFRTMPGGLDAVKNITDELKASGVRVLWPYNPWDTGTRREPLDDQHTFAKLLTQTDGDGFNGDTMDEIPESFWSASTQAKHPIALEPEGGGADQSLNWDTMGWGYWVYPRVPVVDRFKFITHGKFMTNVCDRWAFHKTDNLQMAWFNGDGYESWENVWGTWNGITPYDGEAIRRVATMLRYLGTQGFLHSPDWVPHTADVWQQDVFASKWPLPQKQATVWTIVNRGQFNLTAGLHVLGGDRYYYDCYSGVELKTGAGPSVSPATPKGYNAFPQANSYAGHGGVEMDGGVPLVGRFNAAECAAQCDALSNCSCVTHDQSTGQCWRRASCQPAQFESNSQFDTYLKAQGYSTYAGKNAFTNNGAVDIDSKPVAVSGAAACMARCDSDKACSCVTMSSDEKQCWKRQDCVATGFASDANFVVYMNEARMPTPPAPPSAGPNVSFPLEAHGFGCVIETEAPADHELISFLNTMGELTQRSLFSYSAEWKYLLQTMVDIPRTKLSSAAPADMVLVPKNKFSFVNRGVMIEGDDAHGVDVQYPWEDHPQREHSHDLEVGPFYMDKYPVTNAKYAAYLKATGYKPLDSYNWLKNWNGTRSPPAAIADMPVTYVGLAEARAYCSWAGGRLPHSYEWQYAAQGTDSRAYPWGKDNDQSRYPKQHSGTVFMGSESVTAHEPAGNSPFGVADLVGNVWQYTDEFQDEHTRAVILMGGSNYRPVGSNWYFPQAKPLNTHEKYFLMDDRYERAGTIGFRCVVDATPSDFPIFL